MTTFTTLEGPPSAGKTTELLRNTLVPGRYIIAAPRVELIHEHKRTLDRLFSDRAETPSYKIIYARRSDRLPVGVAIEEAIVRHDDDEHCVLMVAHQGFRHV